MAQHSDHLQERERVTMVRGAPVAVVLVVAFTLLSSIDSRSAVRAQVTGFYSIDCGNEDIANYTDPTTSIVWTPDSSVMKEGEATGVSPPADDSSARLTTLRYFPGNHSKYCYGLSPVASGSPYIVRASFWMGDIALYATQTTGRISFQFIIDAYVASSVNVYLPQVSPLEVELYVMANTSSMSACVARGSGDTPFISSLELRPLPPNTYGTIVVDLLRRPLLRIARVDYGSAISTPPIRYPDDELDRIWRRDTTLPSISASKATTIINDLEDVTPIAVLETAYSPLEGGFHLPSSVDPASHWYLVSLYFAEVDSRVNSSGMRVFDIARNNASLVSTLDVYAQAGSNKKFEIFNITISSGEWMNITFTPTTTSMFAPFISAYELFQFLDVAIQIGTYDADVAALEAFKAALSDLSGYGGDPCLPRGYSYPWLDCSYGLSTRITEIDLSNYGLAGEVPSTTNQLTELTKISLSGNKLQGAIPDLSELANLQILDLSSNNLTGPIPGYLAQLPNLKVLHLQDNHLSGAIPPALLQKQGLDFKYTGNDVCDSSNSSCVTSPTNEAPPPPGPIGSPPSPSSNTGKIVGGVVAVLVVIVAIILAIYYGRRCFRKTTYDTVIRRQAVVDSDHGIVNVAQIFSLYDLELATRNFSEVLGEGGFGEVYKGTLTDGRAVAIKVLKGNRSQGVNEFRNEASLLSTVHHRNVVQLIGYCTEGKLAIVYELMPNGSLHDILFGPNSITTLTWRQRLMIMADAAQGLDYLHHQCVKVIIHRDVKSSNILLGSNLEGKIADLGISKDNDDATTRIIGSRGYLDPEYAVSLRLTTMVDIYSFGVVLFEIITGRPSVFRSHGGVDINLTDWVKPVVERGDLEQLVDPKFERQYNEAAMWNAIDIAMSCIKFNSSERPQKMSEILQCLRSAIRAESHDSVPQVGNAFISPASTGAFSLTEVQAR